MGNIHIWLLATQIVGLSIIIMFAVYVLLQFVDLNKYRNRQAAKEQAIKDATAVLVAESKKLSELIEIIKSRTLITGMEQSIQEVCNKDQNEEI